MLTFLQFIKESLKLTLNNDRHEKAPISKIEAIAKQTGVARFTVHADSRHIVAGNAHNYIHHELTDTKHRDNLYGSLHHHGGDKFTFHGYSDPKGGHGFRGNSVRKHPFLKRLEKRGHKAHEPSYKEDNGSIPAHAQNWNHGKSEKS